MLAGNIEQTETGPAGELSPYNLNSVALACLPEALSDQQYIRDYTADVLRGRERLEAFLREAGIRYWPSRANFVLMHLGAANPVFLAAMRTRGILVRDRSKDPGCDGCVRITLGSAKDNERLFAVLRWRCWNRRAWRGRRRVAQGERKSRLHRLNAIRQKRRNRVRKSKSQRKTKETISGWR